MIRVDVRDAIPEEALDAVWAWFQRVDDLFSTWRDDSEISRLANGELELEKTSPEVRVVLELCEQMRLASDGAFDIAFAAAANVCDLPGRCPIDPTGLVKGWAVDRAAELLSASGASNLAINAGGDILVHGRPRAGSEWRVGVQHPWQRDRTAATVALTEGAVATSGGYERGDHVIDARSGEPARGLASVTVISSTLTRADAYATAALVRGRDGMAWLATVPNVVAMGITDDQRVIKTTGFDDFVVR